MGEGSRAFARDIIDGLIDFGTVVSTEIAAARKSVLATLRGDIDPEGIGEDVGGCEVWESAALLHRPADPDASGACEVILLRRGDELVGIATKDRRWQIDLDKGETVVRALGEQPVRIRLKPTGEVTIEGLTVRVQGDNVTIGSGAGKPIAYGDAIQSHLAAMKTWLDTHTHPAPGGATSAPAAVSPVVPDVASDRHKVE